MSEQSNRPGGYTSVPTWMIRDQSIKRSTVLVYASLASRAGLGVIYPSQATIAEESGVKERTVRSALRELEELGVVERTKRRGTAGQRTTQTDAYLLHPHGQHQKLPAGFAGTSELPAKATGNEGGFTPLIEVENRGSAQAKPKKASQHPLPADWKPTDEHRSFALERGVDVEHEADSFRAHAEANDRRVVVWNAAFRQWLIKARPTQQPAGGRGGQTLTEKWGAGNEWMEYR